MELLLPQGTSTFWKLSPLLRRAPRCFQLLGKLPSPAGPMGGKRGKEGEAEASAGPTKPCGCTSASLQGGDGAREARTLGKAAFKVTKPPRVLSTPQGASAPSAVLRQLKGRSREAEQRRNETEGTSTGLLLCVRPTPGGGRGGGGGVAVEVASSFV